MKIAQLTRPQIVRRTVVGVFTLAAIASGGLGATYHASADSASGYVSIGARMCALPTADPINACGVASVGALSLAETGGGSQILAMDEASYAGDNVVWGDVADVPLTTYAVDTQYLDVPSGFQVAELIPVVGNAGYGANGYYVSLTDGAPSVEAYVIYRPAAGLDTDNDGLNDLAEVTIGTDPYVADIPGPDADGDGASDEIELASGTDPNDPNDWPQGVQAGPSGDEDSDGDGASDAAETAFGSDPYDASDFPAVQAGPSDDDDSDGDGASDAAEVAFGSDPYDASDFPAVQAGPSDENGNGINDDEEDMNGDGVADVIATSLPNTGTGAGSVDGLSEALLLTFLTASLGAAVGGIALTQRG